MPSWNASDDQSDLERRQFYRSLAPVFLLACVPLLLLSPRDYGVFTAFLMLGLVGLSIVFGILGNLWLFVSILVGTIGAIVLLVAVPSLLRTRPRSVPDESAAVSNLRIINTAEITYLSSAGSYASMQRLVDVRLLDDTFTRTRAGYSYTITLDEAGSAYTAEAVPAPVVTRSWFASTASTSPVRYGYYSLQDAVVRYSMEASLAPPGRAGQPVR